VARQRFYGPPNPNFESDALWLAGFMERHGASQEKVSHVLGVNVARVWEWRHQHMPLPPEAKQVLIQWASDGCPEFEYWGRVPQRRAPRQPKPKRKKKKATPQLKLSGLGR
jgi:hypothetical protein